MDNFLEQPAFITIYTEETARRFPGGAPAVLDDVTLEAVPRGRDTAVTLTAGKTPVCFLSLRWNRPLPADARFLGDAWERGYGDLQWRPHDPGRMLPWYGAMRHGDTTFCFGVRVRPGALAQWSADPAGLTLWLDVRCGARGVILGGRTLDAATVVMAEYGGMTPFAALGEFCRVLCPDPLLPPYPVYGGNNWYYAYGDSSQEQILADCDYIAGLAAGLDNRPFMVVDDGWEPRYGQPEDSGPWDGGNSRFPDMPALAAQMREHGTRPGIWFRPLWNLDAKISEEMLLPAKPGSDRRYLDPSVPAVLETVAADVRRIADWGFELVKHDFSTFDIFGLWGTQMAPWPAAGDWAFADRGRTAAEIVTGFYQAIRAAAGDMLILGCNTIGHLGAGLMHIARSGDDTSGIRWDRTRKMGVNCLAFRLCQHRAFFAIDADCLGVAGPIPWELNRQWAELLAKSGTPLFASLRPGLLGAAENAEMRKYFALAARQTTRAEPCDWLDTTVPARWRFDGETREFSWFEDGGTVPDFTGRPQF